MDLGAAAVAAVVIGVAVAAWEIARPPSPLDPHPDPAGEPDMLEHEPFTMTPVAAYLTRLAAIREVAAALGDRVEFANWRDRRGPGGELTADDEEPVSVTNEELVADDDTVGCVIGWACAHPALWALGLTWDPEGNGPVFQDYAGWEAVAEFTGLTEDEATAVFDGVLGAEESLAVSGLFAQLVRADDGFADSPADVVVRRLDRVIAMIPATT